MQRDFIDEMIEGIIRREGGYSNDPNDPGGETHWGISKRSYPNLNIKDLTLEQAKSIYRKDYYFASQCNLLPQKLQEIFLDMTALHGKSGATQILQKAINGVVSPNIQVDGILGRMTISSASKVELTQLRAYRIKDLAEKVVNNPTLEKYWYGWYIRATRV